MYLLRLQALVNSTPLLLTTVKVFAVNGVSLVDLFDVDTEQPISNSFITDASGFVTFKVQTLQSLSFRVLTGLTLSASAYLLYDSLAAPPPTPTNPTLNLPCAETIIEGYVVGTNSVGDLVKCDASNINHLKTAIGLARQTGNIGEVIRVVKDDFFSNSVWNFTPNQPVWVGINGVPTQNLTGLVFLQQIGTAVNSTTLAINISQPFIRT